MTVYHDFTSPPEGTATPPDEGIFDHPATAVTINRLWLTHIISALSWLANPDYWIEAEADRASQEIIKMIECLTNDTCP